MVPRSGSSGLSTDFFQLTLNANAVDSKELPAPVLADDQRFASTWLNIELVTL